MKLGNRGVKRVKEMAYHLSSSFEGSTLNYFINENPDNGVYYGPTGVGLLILIKPPK